MRKSSSLALVALLVLLAAYPAVAEPPAGEELVLVVEEEVEVVEQGVAEQGPWLPLHGGTMEGDIQMQGHAVHFGPGSVRVAQGDLNVLLFDEVPLCTAHSKVRGCASSGDIEAVRAGPGLRGGGEAGAVSLEADFGAVQRRILGVCAPGSSLRSVTGDGGVSCEPDDDTQYHPGNGLNLENLTFSVDTGTIQRRVANFCQAGNAIRAISATGAVTCERDDDTTYRSGFGLTLENLTFAADTSVLQGRITQDNSPYEAGAGLTLRNLSFALQDCEAQQVLKAVGPGSWRCSADGDTTYRAGTGLLLENLTFSVDTSTLQERVDGSCAVGSSIRSIGRDGTVACESDDDTQPLAGFGLTYENLTLSVDPDAVQERVDGSCAVGSSIRAIARDGTVTCETDDDTVYEPGDGTISISGKKISVEASAVQLRVTGACAAGSSIASIAQDGTVGCETDTDTDTTYDAGDGLQLTGTTFALRDCAAGQILEGNATGTWVCARDDDTTYSAGAGLALTGTQFRVADGGIVRAMISANAVDAAKTADEPGVREGSPSGPLTVAQSNVTLATASATFPASGHAMVYAVSTWGYTAPSTGGASYLSLYLMEGSTELEAWRWDPGDNDGEVDQAQSKVSVFPVTAGTHSYTLRGKLNAGSAVADDAQVVIVYFPTTY